MVLLPTRAAVPVELTPCCTAVADSGCGSGDRDTAAQSCPNQRDPSAASRSALVSFEGNRYSVPPAHAGHACTRQANVPPAERALSELARLRGLDAESAPVISLERYAQLARAANQ